MIPSVQNVGGDVGRMPAPTIREAMWPASRTHVFPFIVGAIAKCSAAMSSGVSAPCLPRSRGMRAVGQGQ